MNEQRITQRASAMRALVVILSAGALLGACAAETLDDAPPVDTAFDEEVGGTSSELIYAEPDDPYDDPPLSDPPESFLQRPSPVSIGRRRHDRVDFLFTDRTDVESGYRIYRRAAFGAFELVHTYGPRSGVTTYADTAVLPDTRYCYYAQAYSGSQTLSSTTICAYTPTPYFKRVIRAQVEITVGTVDGAGTDDSVAARLDAGTALTQPFGDETWLDYSHNDFEPGSVHIYDLLFPNRVSDITELTIRKEGTDGLCIANVRLILNQNQTNLGEVVFAHSFAGEPGGCRWVDGDDGHQSFVKFSHSRLRAQSTWPVESTPWCPSLGVCVAQQFPMELPQLEARMEGMIGHALHAVGPISWADDGNGPGSFSLTYGGTSRDLRVRGTLFADGPVFFNGDGSFDFLVRARARAVENETVFSPSLENADVNIDMNFVSDALGAVFLSPVGYVTFIELLEGYIEGTIEERANPLALDLPATTPLDACAMIDISPSGVRATTADCNDLDSDTMNDDWEREHGLDPDFGGDGVQDPDNDGRTNQEESVRPKGDPFCRWDRDHPNYCRDCGPCDAGEADCDYDSECRGGLTCSHNVGTRYDLPSYYDVCECPLAEDHVDYCRVCGPCEIGQPSDCDNDSECVEGAYCRHNVGVFYGRSASYDICECALDPGHPDYCTKCGPCSAGEGDCDGDFDCEAGASCGDDNGADYGMPAHYDACVCDSWYCSVVVASPTYTSSP